MRWLHAYVANESIPCFKPLKRTMKYLWRIKLYWWSFGNITIQDQMYWFNGYRVPFIFGQQLKHCLMLHDTLGVAASVYTKRGKRGQRRHSPYTPYSIGNSSRVIFRIGIKLPHALRGCSWRFRMQNMSGERQWERKEIESISEYLSEIRQRSPGKRESLDSLTTRLTQSCRNPSALIKW